MTDTSIRFAELLARAEQLLAAVENLLPGPPAPPDWNAATAFRWRRRNGRAALWPIRQPHAIRLADLRDIDVQKQRVVRNTEQFLAGCGANNVLLTGARGTGKSSLIKALLDAYAEQGLRVIEVERDDLVDLPDIIELLVERPEKFILFADDLSFEADEPAYKALKSVLDGSFAACPDNVLIYATSNRRHLMPEFHAENLATTRMGDEIHPGEAVEEKISLSERFGLWVSFWPFSQDEYLDVVEHWLGEFGLDAAARAEARQPALQWALMRGSRSGRVAWQFARDFAGQLQEGSQP